MKKLFIAALAVVTFGANAQDVNFKSKRGEYMLPEKGDWALGFSTDGIFEYLGNAFNGDTNNNAPTLGISNTTDNGFRGRFVGKYFIKDKAAYRVVFNLRTESVTTKSSNTSADDVTVTNPVTNPLPVNTLTVLNNDTKNSATEFSVGLGKEWRRGKTRLQGFYGADFLLVFTSGSNSRFDFEEELTTFSAPLPIQTVKTVDQRDEEVKLGSGFGVGLEGFIGAEYFLFPKIAIGAQYTYSARFLSQGKGSQTVVKFDSETDSLPVSPAPSFTSTTVTTVNDTPSSKLSGLSGVGVVSINLTLHF
jgi:hypothetical protein